MYEAIVRGNKFTAKTLAKLKPRLHAIGIPDWSLIINGSYARKEASPSSDLDYFILHDGLPIKTVTKLENEIKIIVRDIVGHLPSEDGAFGTALKVGSLTKNIGGTKDKNKNITRRILFLTEGAAVHNPSLHIRQRDALIDRYINKEISDHQLGLFLLNDVIRYYRTVCVDFEFKTFESNKEWGLRNIKLVFSRKLLYFSGALIVAETAQRTPSEKKEIIKNLISLSPIERIKKVCGSASDRAMASYNIFLTALEDDKIRTHLKAVTSEKRKDSEIFKRLKNEGQHFSDHLLSALRSTYSESHPIHRALIM